MLPDAVALNAGTLGRKCGGNAEQLVDENLLAPINGAVGGGIEQLDKAASLARPQINRAGTSGSGRGSQTPA